MDRSCEVYIHVGFQKCGSTLLQRRFFPELENVFWYQRSPVLKKVLNQIWKRHPFVIKQQELERELRGTLEQIEERKALISHEGLVGGMMNNYYDHFRYRMLLERFFPEARILLFIRKQDALIESIYKQTLKEGYLQPFRKFVNWKDGEFQVGKPVSVNGINIDVRVLDYRAFYQAYTASFGEDNVMVIPFERMRFDKERILREIKEFMGVQGPERFEEQSSAVNKGYSQRAVKAAWLLNRFFRYSVNNGRGLIPVKPGFQALQDKENKTWKDRFLLGVSKRLDPRYWLEYKLDALLPYRPATFFTEEQREKVRALHREHNEKLDQELGLDLKELGYY